MFHTAGASVGSSRGDRSGRQLSDVTDGAGFGPFSRVAGVDPVWFGVREESRSERDDRLLTDSDARGDPRMGTDPGSVLNGDGLHQERHGRIGPVVISGAKVGALGDADIRANGDRHEVVDPGAFAEPDMITDNEVPRVLDMDTRFDDQPFADFRAEDSKDSGLQVVGGCKRIEQNDCFDDEPKRPKPEWSTGIVPGGRGMGEIDARHDNIALCACLLPPSYMP